jgi:hypothetical protein
MNQEQNNLNPNNFNTQGNNGIPNNQPLNNQSFNQGMGFNQQPINPQPQPTPSYQQPIMQEPTPQPMNNTFESGNANSQNFNSKPPKKMNLGLIIGIVVAVAVVGVGIAFGSKLLSNGNGGTSSSVNQNLDGKVKLVKNYNQISTYIDTGDLNQIHFDAENKVIDIKGNVIVNAEFTKRKYLGDDYYAVINGNNIVITKNTDEIFKFVNNGNIAYDNNTLYYTTIVNNEKFIVAYDLSNKKELWKTRGENPFILENGNIAVKGYSNTYDNRYDSYGIIDKNGNVIAFADKNTAVYPTATTYYFKLVNKKLEIYNGTTKVNEFSLETKDKVFYEFVSPLSNGMFVIKEYDSNTFKNIYKVYDRDLKLVVELDDCNGFEGSVLGYSDLITVASTYNDAEKSIISGAIKSETGNLDVIIYANGTIEKLYFARLEDGMLSTLSAKNFRTKHYMVGIEVSNGTNGIKVINLDNGKSKKTTDGSWTANGIADSPNGKYAIINYDTTYNDSKKKIVLDENLESLYETENQLKVVNDKFVIEYSLKSKSEIYLVNVFTKEKTKLDTTGDYYDNNSVGLITSNNGTYNLYSLN